MNEEGGPIGLAFRPSPLLSVLSVLSSSLITHNIIQRAWRLPPTPSGAATPTPSIPSAPTSAGSAPRHGRRYGLPPPLRRILPLYLRPHPLQGLLSPLLRRLPRLLSCRLASQSHVVFSMVGHPHDVRSVLLDPASGALSALSPGSVLVDCTSSHPALAREVALAAKDKSCFAVDAPLSGGNVGARDGTLAILAGGNKEVVEWLSPLFDLLGKVTWMGPPSSGQISKIGNQIAVAGSVMGTTEGILFARKVGLDAAAFLEAIGSGAAGSKVMQIFGGRILKRDFLPGGYVEYMVKDLGMALETPNPNNDGNSLDSDGAVALPGAALFRQMFTGMVANGDGKMRMQGLITVHERMNGNGNGIP